MAMATSKVIPGPFLEDKSRMSIARAVGLTLPIFSKHLKTSQKRV